MSKEIYVKKIPKSCHECCLNYGLWCGVTMCDMTEENRKMFCPLQDIHDHDKELIAKVLKEVEDSFTAYLPLKNRTGAWFYGRLNEILKKYQKEFEDGK